jgi:hypothetical protein
LRERIPQSLDGRLELRMLPSRIIRFILTFLWSGGNFEVKQILDVNDKIELIQGFEEKSISVDYFTINKEYEYD